MLLCQCCVNLVFYLDLMGPTSNGGNGREECWGGVKGEEGGVGR